MAEEWGLLTVAMYLVIDAEGAFRKAGPQDVPLGFSQQWTLTWELNLQLEENLVEKIVEQLRMAQHFDGVLMPRY